jgi:predicted SpoU family rRNA methylase
MRWLNLITIISALFIGQAFAQRISSYDFSVVREWMSATEKLYYGFSSNRGQINKEALLYSKGPGFNIYITEKGLSFTIFSFEKEDSQIPKMDDKPIKENIKKGNIKAWRIDYDLIGGNIKKENIVFEDEIENYYENYYTQYAPDGILFVRLYKKVRIKEVYPGIDWILRYDENGNFHHEFEASPNSNIAQIKIKVKNAEIELTDEGKSVLLKTPIGTIKDGNLIAYEGKKELSAIYTIKDNLLSFEIKDYEGREILLIDPYAVVWAITYGGTHWDEAYSVSTDANGNVFVVGYTRSTDFPTQDIGGGAYYQSYHGGGWWDAFILKFNNNGNRLWATYYGGNDDDHATSVSTDNYGNVFVVGYTRSTDFPTQNLPGAYYQPNIVDDYDAFIIKFNNSGVRLWATYYGGSFGDYATSVSTDNYGNVFVVGHTYSFGDFPTYNPGGNTYYQSDNANPGSFDAFILKFTNNGVRLWATYYGGSDEDYATSVSAKYGNVFVVGYTRSTNFPTYCNIEIVPPPYCQSNNAGDYDAFIIEFNNNGVRRWAIYYGGSNEDYATSVSTDNYGNVFVVGYTRSTNFPTKNLSGAYYQSNNAGGYDAFIIKFDGDNVRRWATYYGGSFEDYATSVSINNYGNVLVVGYTTSTNFPTYNPGGSAYYQPSLVGSSDAFILEFNKNGVRLWATYYGGNRWDHATSVSTDNYGNVFVVGYTHSNNLPTHNPGGDAHYQASKNGGANQVNSISTDANFDRTCKTYGNCNDNGIHITDWRLFISKFTDVSSTSIPESFISSIKIKNNNVIIKLNENINGEFKVFTILGREIIRGKVNNNEISFKVPSSGIYILKVNNKNVKIVVN